MPRPHLIRAGAFSGKVDTGFPQKMRPTIESIAAMAARPPPSTSVRRHRLVAEQTDLEVHRPVDDRAVRRKPAVGNAEHELGTHHPLDVDAIDDILDGREYLAGEFELAQTQRAAFAGRAEPTE